MLIDPDEKIPKDHRFDVQAVNKQTLGVFSQNSKFHPDQGQRGKFQIFFQTADDERSDKLIRMEGTIVEKLECRPYADQTYMAMKAKSIKIAAQPKRKVEQLDSVVTSFKPISDHKHNVRFYFL